MQVLVVNAPRSMLRDGAADHLREIGWEVTSTNDYAAAAQAAHSGLVDAVIIGPPDDSDDPRNTGKDLDSLLQVIETKRIAAMVMADRGSAPPEYAPSLIDTVDASLPLAELRGRLAMIARYQGLIKRLDHELGNMQRLGFRLNEHFREVDHEMRLAGRLQSDFLPDLDQPFDNVQFAAAYRPVTWVSGDIFDVFRVDEDTTGFYIADAVGHGMAAGLLTMFIKRAIVPKRHHRDGYSILAPSETIALLNESLNSQALPNCQFVTACYGLINHRTLTLRLARGGHPYPILIPADGDMRELSTPGGLLGVFEGAEYPTLEVQLHPGDKVLLYTDGVELGFVPEVGAATSGADAVSGSRELLAALHPLAASPIGDLVDTLANDLTTDFDPHRPHDDITLLGLEVLDGSSTPDHAPFAAVECP